MPSWPRPDKLPTVCETAWPAKGRCGPLARFLNCDLIEATTAQLAVWLSRPIADATRISTLSHLHAFYAWVVAEGLIESSPTEVFRGRGTAGMTLAPTPAAMHMNGDDEVSVALVPVPPRSSCTG